MVFTLDRAIPALTSATVGVPEREETQLGETARWMPPLSPELEDEFAARLMLRGGPAETEERRERPGRRDASFMVAGRRGATAVSATASRPFIP